jgi:hypothetical protein
MDRNGIWGVYVIMNVLAIVFNLSLVISIWRLRDKKTSTEVLIGGLSSGIVLAAMGCGPQCLMSSILGTFAFGDKACFAEAFLHLVGMEIQFICVAAISHRTYVGVVKLAPYPPQKAIYIVAFAWVFAVFTTAVMGYFSDYYLVASGTFCFYKWTSPALIFAAWPMAITSVCLMGFWYWKTYQAFRTVRDGAKDFRQEKASSSSLDRDLAIRLSLLVILFLFGYVGIISQSLYEIMVGRAKAWGDIVAALMVLIYWDSIAFCYAHANKRLGIKAVLFFLPEKLAAVSVKSPSTGLSVQSTKESHKGDGEETDTVESLVKFPGLNFSRKHSSHKDVEMPSLSAESSSLLSDLTQKGKSGIERLEGPKDYMPFFPVDGEESIRGYDTEGGNAEESGKQIFNPFQPTGSPTSAGSPSGIGGPFDFALRTPETPSSRSDIPELAITPRESPDSLQRSQVIVTDQSNEITITLGPISPPVESNSESNSVEAFLQLKSKDCT